MRSLLLPLALLVGVALADVPVRVSVDDAYDFGNGYQYQLTSSGFLDSVLSSSGDREVQNVPLKVASRADSVLNLLPFLGLREAYMIARKVGIKDILKESQYAAVTLFAPTNAAIHRWRESVPAGFEEDAESMTKLCKAWIVPYAIKSAEFADNKMLPTLLDAPEVKLRVNIYNERKNITINGAPIVRNLVDYTIGSNVVHAIAKVPYPLPIDNVYDILAKVDSFSKLFKLVEIADLQGAFANIDPLTVFAPANKAFDLLPASSMAELQANKTKLQYVLKSHLSRGASYSAGIRGNADSVESFAGQQIRVNVENGTLLLNKPIDKSSQAQAAKIISRDVPATNGVIHVIDKLLVSIPLEG